MGRGVTAFVLAPCVAGEEDMAGAGRGGQERGARSGGDEVPLPARSERARAPFCCSLRPRLFLMGRNPLII